MEWLSKPQPRNDGWDNDDTSDGCGYGGYGSHSGYGYGGSRSNTPVTVYHERAEHRTAAPLSTAAAGTKATASAQSALKLQAGETVEHDTFGRGLVVSVRPMGGDALVEVAFDAVGTKKLMLKAAAHHLKKV